MKLVARSVPIQHLTRRVYSTAWSLTSGEVRDELVHPLPGNTGCVVESPELVHGEMLGLALVPVFAQLALRFDFALAHQQPKLDRVVQAQGQRLLQKKYRKRLKKKYEKE